MRRDLKLEILSSNVVSEEFVLSSQCFAFNKTSFHTQWMVRGILCMLKGFSRLVIRTYSDY